ncbi:MAG: cytochrome c-type biogenesis protein CcmH [Rhodobacteraceae bacterium]|jgi:cytochrome c-type biogenesis protein CcmH|nr:cytochrome c-type biogenesis protein CcmH [Paracoccaceae bacterium]
MSRRGAKRLALALVLILAAGAAPAVQPDEILADPALEARAREIGREIRCPVCQGESIDDSNAPISRDLRIILRERLVAGDTNDEVIDYLVDRYGEFILFKPRATGANWILWLAGPVMLVAAGGVAVLALRRKSAPEPALSPEEQARLAELMRE